MNNREIVDYILSNKLTENDVIKRIEYDEDYYENGICVMYLFNNKYELWDDNGEVSIFDFCDKKYNYKYEVISKEQAIEEINNKEKQEKIQRLENELERLKKEVS